MNAFAPGDFGDLESLLKALGLADDGGGFNSDWIARPEHYLSRILADEAQRTALLDFVATVRGGDTETDPDGRRWALLFSEQVDAGLLASFFIVLDDQPSAEVHLFLGVRMETGSPLADSVSSLLFPLFRAAKAGSPAPPDPILAGRPGGRIALSSEITVGPPPPPGDAGLARVGLRISVPTAPADGSADLGLTLGGLQLPGESGPRDLTLSLTDPAALADTATELILALLEAQIRGGGGAEIRAFASMLGLGGAPEIPELPASDLLERGADALADWIAQVLGSAPSRARWLQALADLLGGGATADATGVTLPLGGTSVRIGCVAEPGPSARPVVTVSLAFGTSGGTSEARITADLVRLDLGRGEAVAVPSVEAALRLDLSGVAMPDVSVERLVLGLALDESRRPVAVAAVENAVVFGTRHARLDLTNPDALAAAAATAASDALSEVLGNLGAGADLIGVALGWQAPVGAAPGYPTTDLLSFLGDPLGALRAHWLAVLDDHAADVTAALASLRALLTGVADAAAITGTGTQTDPWRLPITAGAHVAVWRTDAGRLALGLGWLTRVDDLGERCTVIEMRARVALVETDLATGATAAVPAISVAGIGRARGGGRLRTGSTGLMLEVDHLGLVAEWRAETGLALRLDAPNPSVDVDGVTLPLELPDLTRGLDPDILTAAQWDGIERIAGLLAERTGSRLVVAMADALGWRRTYPVFGAPDPNRLRLARVASDPAQALRAWLGGLLTDPQAGVVARLEPVARLLAARTDGRLSVAGTGTVFDPWRVSLPAGAGAPALGVWRMPGRPEPEPDIFFSRPIRAWQPGEAGLAPDVLAQAIRSELPAAAEGLDQATLDRGLRRLVAAWTDGDGLLRPPVSAPPGTILHLVAGVDARGLMDDPDVEPFLGDAPPVLFVVRTVSEIAALPDGTNPARLVDLRATDREATAFPQVPDDASGAWTVLLAPRPDVEGGAAGQAARLAHALAPAAGIAGAAVLADRAAGHAAWRALDGMGPGLDRLMIVGLAPGPVAPLDPDAAEALLRLEEILPAPDPAEPDDADLALGRRLIAERTGSRPLAELAPPADWTGARRAGLAIHVLHGVIDRSSVSRAVTAVTAAGLSLYSQGRAARARTERTEAAGFGLLTPLGGPPAAGAIGFDGRALLELVSVGLDRSGVDGVRPVARAAGRIVLSGRITRGNGWLVGGPDGDAAASLALRSIEIDANVGAGGAADPDLDRVQVVFNGVRIYDERHARLVVTPDTTGAFLAGAAPTAPGIRALLAEVIAEAAVAPGAGMAELLDLLRATGILGAGDAFDPLSLSHWIDDPAAQLRTALANPALRAPLLSLVASVVADSGVTFDASGRLDVTLGGTTAEPLFGEWSLEASLGASGLATGALRIGRSDGPGLRLSLAPFTAEIVLPEGLPDVPTTLPLWPAPNIAPLARALPPTLAAAALGRILEGLRASDPAAETIVNAALAAFGLEPEPIALPAALFADPGGWLAREGVLGGPGGGIRAPRVIAVMDALRPLVGAGGGAGIWTLAPGLALAARDDGGLVMELQVDPGAFLPADRIALGGSFGVRFPPGGGATRPAVSIFAGLSGAGPTGLRAVHLSVAGETARLFLRPGAGADIEIYPGPPDLSNLAAAGLVAALPVALDAIVDTGTDAGDLLADLGDALLLRDGGGFDGPAMEAWALDPAGNLAARWPDLVTSGLARLGPVLPAGVTVVGGAGSLRVAVANAGSPGSTVAIELFTAPLAAEISATLTALPFVGGVDAQLRFDGTGLARLAATAGPAEIPVAPGLILRPIAEIEVGSAVPAPRVGTGLALDPAGLQALRLTYDFTAERFDLGVGTDTPEEIAAGIMHVAVELLGGFVLSLDPVDDVLDMGVGDSDVRGVLTDVVLTPAGSLDPEFFRVLPRTGETDAELLDSKLDRILALIANIADAGPSVRIGGEVDIGLGRSGGVVGLTLGIANRLAIVDGGIMLWLENDSRWIIGGPDPGLEIGLLRIGAGGASLEPTLSVNGVGLRIGRKNAPLLDSPIALGSIAIHGFGRVSASETLGGGQVELAEIGAQVGGGSGDNAVASGLLSQTSDGDAALAPAFSPAIAVQTRPAAQGGGVAFSFRAGEGEGPWWLPIRKTFGPLYVDQVGLGTQVQDDSLASISLLFDGSVTIAGLSASVDDLELIYRTDRGGLFDSASWGVDLKGLGISADLSGISLAGGLRKFGEGTDIEYVGMIAARFAVYGLSVYGGYAAKSDAQGRYTAFFAVGAFVGPVGGAPCFFVTGIGGGFGINRDLVPPTDLGDFGDFVLIQALDPAADLPSDVIDYLGEVRETFPAARGKFWFAAGISFTSFALVDGIAVVAVEFGNGFELSIFGLARMALPRPAFALVSIELGLLARFSTEEGVIWIQAQLTDNSWLLHRSARLTGGFAYVSWFKGPNKGQFVLTLGGYHPNFKADGYPVVPRLGYNWSVSSNIVIKAETYFALTSEAIMGGGAFEASAKFGRAYASLGWGGNAIVYFDPFRYEADAYARVSAGIRIKTWFGTIKLSFSLSAEIQVAGPEFHGSARIKVGPINVTVRFGPQDDPPVHYISWVDFAAKYLELAPGNTAEALTAIAGKGALPPGSGEGDPPGTADGTAAHPFDVMSEFELALTSTIPLTRIVRPGRSPVDRDPTSTLGVAPVNLVVSEITLTLRLRKDGSPGEERLDDLDKIKLRTRDTGAFPVGVWGPPQGLDDKSVPKGKVIGATEGLNLRFQPELFGKRPADSTGGVAFNQIEAGPRKPLPLRETGAFFASITTLAQEHRQLLGQIGDLRMATLSAQFQTTAKALTGARAWDRSRRTPMRVGLLTERIVAAASPGRKRVIAARPPEREVIAFGTARLRGMLVLPTAPVAEIRDGRTRTTTRAPVGIEQRRLQSTRPPTLDGVLAARTARAPAMLLRSAAAEPRLGQTVVAEGRVPVTLNAGVAASAGVARAAGADRRRLDAVATMVGAERPRGADPRGTAPAPLAHGEIAVFDLPGAARSPRFKTSGTLALGGAARVVALGLDGRVLANTAGTRDSVTLPRGTAAFSVIAGDTGTAPEFAGWTESESLAYLGRSLARCRGGFVFAEGASRSRGGRRGGTGWLRASELTDQSALVETRFDHSASSVALLLDGVLGEKDLATLAISVRGAKAGERPILAPFGGKTLVGYALTGTGDAALSVRIAGLIPGRLDGVIAGRTAPDRLIARLLNESVALSVGVPREDGAKPVRVRWSPPADVTRRIGEDEEF